MYIAFLLLWLLLLLLSWLLLLLLLLLLIDFFYNICDTFLSRFKDYGQDSAQKSEDIFKSGMIGVKIETPLL